MVGGWPLLLAGGVQHQAGLCGDEARQRAQVSCSMGTHATLLYGLTARLRPTAVSAQLQSLERNMKASIARLLQAALGMQGSSGTVTDDSNAELKDSELQVKSITEAVHGCRDCPVPNSAHCAQRIPAALFVLVRPRSVAAAWQT